MLFLSPQELWWRSSASSLNCSKEPSGCGTMVETCSYCRPPQRWLSLPWISWLASAPSHTWKTKWQIFLFVVALGSSMRTCLLLTKSFLNCATFDLMLKLWVLCVWGVSVCRGECVWMCESFSEWQSKQSHWYRPPTLSNPNTQMYYGRGCAIRKQDYTYWPLLEVLYLVKSKICCWSFSCQSKSIVSLSFIVT